MKIDKGDAELIARIIADNEVNEAPMYSYWDGEKGASVVVENQKDLSPRQILISEYGDILTVKKIRSRMGATE
uniref:Uncharacterized protein n=1 Tax=viral metagenome TaxID=1070528 RepID=A0A6H1ZGT8_9ZZZZ